MKELIKRMPTPEGTAQMNTLLTDIDALVELWAESGRPTATLMQDIQAAVEFYWPE